MAEHDWIVSGSSGDTRYQYCRHCGEPKSNAEKPCTGPPPVSWLHYRLPVR